MYKMRLLSLFSCLLLVFCLIPQTVFAREENSLQRQNWLYTQNGRLTDSKGQPFQLRGVNLGGWLVQESWMTPNNGEDKKWGAEDTWALLTQRFGESKARELMKIYENNWITEEDLDVIQSLGMNCVRVPFWYRNLQDSSGDWLRKTDGSIDFSSLDWIVEECAQRRMYVVLDLHGAPGYQNNDHSSGKVNAGRLFEDSPEGEQARKRTVDLWVQVALHFRDQPFVAAYDLLNEPMNGFERRDKKDKALWDFYDTLYQAIRKVDPSHLISMEGVWELKNLPDPAKYGWLNVLYQLHNYNWKTTEIDRKIRDAVRHAHWNVPIYIGEFQGGEIWDYTLNAYNQAGFSWTTWSYKGAKSAPDNDWFLFSGTPPIVNLQQDSVEEIAQKWGEPCRTAQSFQQNNDLSKRLKQAAETPVPARTSVEKTRRTRSRINTLCWVGLGAVLFGSLLFWGILRRKRTLRIHEIKE